LWQGTDPGNAALALDQVLGKARPARGVLQAAGGAAMDESPAVRGPAGLDRRARAAADGAAAGGAGKRDADDGHDRCWTRRPTRRESCWSCACAAGTWRRTCGT
jgi:hypothetical protein